jgi:hypothetical protein
VHLLIQHLARRQFRFYACFGTQVALNSRLVHTGLGYECLKLSVGGALSAVFVSVLVHLVLHAQSCIDPKKGSAGF